MAEKKKCPQEHYCKICGRYKANEKYDEIAAVPKPVRKMKLDENELSMAKMLIENMTKPFVAEDYHDEYQERLREAIMKKIEGQEIVSADTGSAANVIDLMDAL